MSEIALEFLGRGADCLGEQADRRVRKKRTPMPGRSITGGFPPAGLKKKRRKRGGGEKWREMA